MRAPPCAALVLILLSGACEANDSAEPRPSAVTTAGAPATGGAAAGSNAASAGTSGSASQGGAVGSAGTSGASAGAPSAGGAGMGGGGGAASGGSAGVSNSGSAGVSNGGSSGASNGGSSGTPNGGGSGMASGGSSGAPNGGSSGTPNGGGSSVTGPLVPEQGALLGQFYGDESIAATSAKLGRTLPIHLTYYGFADDWYNAKPDLDAGRIPFVNWEPFGVTLDEILSGAKDGVLLARAQQAVALKGRFFVDFGAEMNGDWSPWSGAQNGKSPAKFIAAYRYVHDKLVGAGASNIVWAWCPNVTDEPREAWNETLAYYPGDQYVDWACVDGYNWGGVNGIAWQSFHDVFAGVYAKLATLGKPIIIGEMASAESGGNKALWIGAIPSTLQQDFPLIKGLIWFDINKEADWRISSSTASEAAFATLAAHPYLSP